VAVDCAAPWRAGFAGFFGAVGLAVVAVGLLSAGAPAAGAGAAASSAGSTVSFWICFSSVRSLATFFWCWS
jgi:hypothetical protein